MIIYIYTILIHIYRTHTCRQRQLHVSVGREALPEMEVYDFRASKLTVLKLAPSSELQKEPTPHFRRMARGRGTSWTLGNST